MNTTGSGLTVSRFNEAVTAVADAIVMMANGKPVTITAVNASGERITWRVLEGDPYINLLQHADERAQCVNGDSFAIGVAGIPLRTARRISELVRAEILH